MDIETIRGFIRDGNYYFHTHALIEAKKDGVTPEDIGYVILSGEIIEEYSGRSRVLVYGTMENRMQLHVVCDYSNRNILIIPTVYIPSRRHWIAFQRRKRKDQK